MLGRIEALALALLVGVGLTAIGQDAATTPKKKSALEERLEQALRDNPDIRVAEARVLEAQAQLSRARLQVVQQVVTAYQEEANLRAQVEQQQEALAALQLHVRKGYASTTQLQAAEAKLAEAKAAAAAAQAQIQYLLGRTATSGLKVGKDPRGAMTAALADLLARDKLLAYRDKEIHRETLLGLGFLARVQQAGVQGPMSEKLRGALDKVVDIETKPDVRVTELPGLLQKHLPAGVYVKVIPGKSFPNALALQIKGLPLGAALQYLEDSLPGGRIVVRGYGLLISDAERAPKGAPGLHEFWQPTRPTGGKK